jgi:hypothetical protein
MLPNGMAFGDPKGPKYMKQGGKVYRFASERAFQSWSVPLRRFHSKYHGPPPESDGVLGFRAGSLIQGFYDARVYYISDNLRREITSPDVWEAFGFQWDEVIVVNKKELELHELGEELGV